MSGPTAVLTCPCCGYAEVLSMPSNACLHFHRCSGCGRLLTPRPGHCCVFCSYGSVRCPPAESEGVSDRAGLERLASRARPGDRQFGSRGDPPRTGGEKVRKAR